MQNIFGDYMSSRTDLAIEDFEEKEKYPVDRIISGMRLRKCIVDKNASKRIHKKEGEYYSIDNLNYFKKDNIIIKLISSIIYDMINKMKKIESVLIVGLGNPSITPDSLGPRALKQIEVNRHLENEKRFIISAITPGVMGQTGMESSDIIKAIVDDFKPDLVVVIDALACNRLERICKSIQFGSSINPGSGIYNNRKELSKETLGCDVIAIDIPTVCDLKTIMDIDDSYFITTNDIDQAMDILSGIVAKGINKAFI